MSPNTSYPLESKNSARYEPSWPVMPVMSALGIGRRSGTRSGDLGREGRPALRLVPVYGAPQALLEADCGSKPELLLGSGSIELAAGLAVGLGGVPGYASPETGGVGNQFGQFANADLGCRAKVQRLRLVVALRSQYDTLRSVLHVQKLSGGCAVAPHRDLHSSRVSRIYALLNERRDDV